MRPLRSITTALSLLGVTSLVWIVASCASQGEEPQAPAPDAATPDSGTVIEVPDAADLQVCTDGRWCAVKPPVTAPAALTGIWGTGADDVWITASPDIAIHWNGTAFDSTHLKTPQTLFGIWGTSATDIWAFSTGDAIWHNAGAAAPPGSWSAAEKPDASADPPPWNSPIYGMWGHDAHDVWAVGPAVGGQSQTVWHSEGWQAEGPNWVSTTTTPGAQPWDTEPSFNAVWGSREGEVWVVGDKGKTRYTSGWKDGAATWTVVDSGTSLDLDALWGSDTGEIWAAGVGGVMRRFTHQPNGKVAVQIVDFPSLATVRTLYGFSASDIWAAGTDGLLAHWDGTSWSLVDLGSAVQAPAGDKELFAMWASGPDDLWAVGRNVLLHKGPKLLPGTTKP